MTSIKMVGQYTQIKLKLNGTYASLHFDNIFILKLLTESNPLSIMHQKD